MTAWIANIRRIAAVLCAAASLCVAGAAHAEEWSPNEDDAVLLELRSSGYKLGEALRGYQTPGGICVDFADLIQTLDLPVRLDKKSRRATGWLFAEDQRLTIDREANTVQTMNRNQVIAPGAIRDTPQGWCVDLTALSGWMGVRFKPDLGNLAVVIESDRKLPFLEAIERRKRAARLRSPDAGNFDLASLPQAPLAYRGWRTPSVDIQLQGQWSSQGGTTAAYEALATGEALGMSYSARIAGSGVKQPDSLRLRVFRNDPEGSLLGPLRATQLALGDVETLSGGLTAQGAYGRGAFLSNRPLNRPARFGTTSLRGVLPAGWDAELYRNGELRAFQADRGDGRYEFNEIELLFGDNDFEVVLHGPQGQVRRESSSVPVGSASIPPGETWYWGGIVDQGRDLFTLNRQIANAATGGWRWGIGVERGLDRRTTAGLEYQSLMLGGRRRNYGEATLRRALGSMLVELSGAQQIGGGQAWRGQALGRIGGVRFDAHALWVNGAFESELVPANRRGDFGLRFNTALRLGGWQLPLELGGSREIARNGSSTDQLSLRSSLRIKRLSLTAELSNRAYHGTANATAGAGDSGTQLSLIGSTSIGGWRLRGTTRFGLGGGAKGLRAVQLVGEAPLNEVSTLRAGVEYDADSRRREVTLGYVRQFRKFALRAEGRADNHGRIGFGLTLAFSLGPDPAGGGWRMARERLAEDGQASIEVFRDDNGDGIRQPDEAPIEGVAIEAGFRHSDGLTNAKGRTAILGLQPYVPVLVSIDTGKLPDPLLQPKGQGVVVIPRPGVAARVELPLAPTGEIEAVLLGSDGEPRGGVTVELLDSANRAVRRGISDFDGYLLFDSVPYGSYRLRIAASSADALHVAPDIGGSLRIDRAQASLRLGQLRLVDIAPPRIASAP